MSAGAFADGDRFVILSQLGAGGMGVVYRVEDRERGAEVALKILRRVDPEAIFLFKREFRVLSDVVHPNLVPLYELVSNGDHWYFTMELVDGVDFLAHVRGEDPPASAGGARADGARAREVTVVDASGLDAPAGAVPAAPSPTPATGRQAAGPEHVRSADTTLDTVASPIPAAAQRRAAATALTLDPPERSAPPLRTAAQLARLRAGLIQLVEGVAALHQIGQLHRDLKPSNVMARHDGRIVILDFGVITALGAQLDPEHTARVVGTPAYMAPEQARGLPLSTASDWYAVGVMLYEALAGRRPFEGRVSDVLEQKCALRASAPSQGVDGVPADLEALCLALLARDPEDRPGIEDIRRRLGIAPPLAAPARLLPALAADALLVGREAELATLAAAFARARDGSAQTVRVHGGSGVGKTTLVTRFLDGIDAGHEAVVLRGRCHERESVPYRALDSSMDELTQHLLRLPAAEVARLIPPNVRDLARLFPVLRRIEAVLADSVLALDGGEPHELRRRAIEALRALVIALAERTPLVLAVDDVQWGDADSAALLAGVLRAPRPRRLLVVASYRSEDAQRSPFLRAFLAAEPSAIEVAVEPLSPARAEELVGALLSSSSASTAQAAAIARESQGNPFFVRELASYVAESQAAGRPSSLENVSFDVLLRSRLAGLPAGARRMLEIVAVAGQPVRQGVVTRAMDRSASVASDLAHLRSARLVRTQGARDQDLVETYHDRIRETLVAQLDGATLRDDHLRLARAFASYGKPDDEAVAIHLEGGGELARAAAYYETAADAATHALAFEHAAVLYRRAIELASPTGERRATLYRRLADAFANSRRSVDAAAAYLEAAQTAGGVVALDCRRRAAEKLLSSGHVDEGVARLTEVLEQVRIPAPTSTRDAFKGILLRRAQRALRGLGFRPRDASQVSPELSMRMQVCWSAWTGFSMVDSIHAAYFQVRHLLLALESGERSQIALALASEATILAFQGTRGARRAERHITQARELADAAGDDRARGIVWGCSAIVAYMAGRWRDVCAACDTAEPILRERCTDVAWELSCVRQWRLWALYFLGDFSELSRRVPALLHDAEQRGDQYTLTNVSTGLPNATWLGEDRPEEAIRVADESMRAWSSKGFHFQHYWHVEALLQAQLYAGQAEAALAHVLAAWPRFERAMIFKIEAVRMHMLFFRGRAYFDTAPASGAKREQHLRAAQRDYAQLLDVPNFGCRAMALSMQAALAVARGRPERAPPLLEAAAREHDDLEMHVFAASTRFRLASLRGDQDARARALATLAGRGIVNPERFADFLCPSAPLSDRPPA